MKRFAMMVFAVLAIAIAAMAQSAIHVCRTDGSIITVADSTIRGMEWVNVDSQGVAHANYVMLVIRTDTDTLRLPLTAIDSISFKPMIEAIAVTTVTAPSVAYNGATLAGSVTGVYDQNVTAIGMIYGTMAELSATVGTKAASGSTANGDYTVAIGGLSSGTEYYYRAYVEVGSTVYLYGEVKSFTTAEYESVDLGLSVKWAACNVGTTSPEGNGSLYAWGETSAKDGFTQSNYKYYSSGGYTDIGTDISGTDCDAARANWGDHWRMPTSAEMQELCDSCTWTWIYQNSVAGMKVTGKNGNSIFLPAAGSKMDISFGIQGRVGEYWSSTVASTSGAASKLLFNLNGDHLSSGNSARYAGLSIRPIFEIITASTDSVTAIYPTGATLAGSVAGNSKSTISMGMIYGTASTLSAASGTKVASSRTSYGTYTVDLRTLSASTTYYYRAYALRENEYIYGEVKSFTTPAYDAAGDAIDLGLSVRWANCNVGAASPEGYGGYYGWADPTGTKTSKNLNDYPSANPPSSISGTEYDMARAKWGGIWRLPTKAEQQELIDSCTWTLTTQNGVKGYKVTGKNGNSIFLPAAGYRIGPGMADVGKFCNYWSGTLVDSFPDNACDFNSYSGPLVGNDYRFIGFSVRPVILISAVTDSASDIMPVSVTLTGTVIGTSAPHDTISCGMFYSTQSAGVKSGTKIASNSSGDGTFSLTLYGLLVNTTYYYCAYLMIDSTYYYGEVKSFTTKDCEAVDLGLSVKWASCNVGATKPEEYGGYYGWADPTGTKTSTNVDDYPSANPPSEISGTEYDIARAKWGGNWRLPTQADVQELISSCTWTLTTQNGVNGYKVTGTNGNSIFLPAAGYRDGTGLYGVGTYGSYWSGTLCGSIATNAYNLGFGNGGSHVVSNFDRDFGFTVRPVVK
jgi:hypothetical protein